MTHFNVEKRTIYKVKHGSHAYGLNTPTSDLDIKGVCIEPKEYHFGFVNNFEQFEQMESKGHENDTVIFSLKKFAKLASDCNPNIIEVLWVHDEDVLFMDEFGEQLREAKKTFLSRKVRHTFAGYARAQLQRIKTHRNWLLNPPKAAPERSEYGLGETTKVSKSELGAFESLLQKNGEVNLPKDVVTLFVREKAYHAAKDHFDQYINWTKTRNPARAELEAKFGYDTKHAYHLIRLMRMCKEILVSGIVNVRRVDREELLEVRSGKWEYDRVINHAEELEAECEKLYETSNLPHSPDRNEVDKFVVDLTERFLKKNGEL